MKRYHKASTCSGLWHLDITCSLVLCSFFSVALSLHISISLLIALLLLLSVLLCVCFFFRSHFFHISNCVVIFPFSHRIHFIRVIQAQIYDGHVFIIWHKIYFVLFLRCRLERVCVCTVSPIGFILVSDYLFTRNIFLHWICFCRRLRATTTTTTTKTTTMNHNNKWIGCVKCKCVAPSYKKKCISMHQLF